MKSQLYEMPADSRFHFSTTKVGIPNRPTSMWTARIVCSEELAEAGWQNTVRGITNDQCFSGVAPLNVCASAEQYAPTQATDGD